MSAAWGTGWDALLFPHLSLTIYCPAYYVLAWGTQDISTGWLHSSSQQKRGAAHHRLWHLVWLTGEALQHQQLQPVGTGNQAVGYGILQPPCHHLPDNTCPPPLLHTACKQIKKIWSMTCSSFQFLPLTSPYGDALSAHSNPLCLHTHTWPKNT